MILAAHQPQYLPWLGYLHKIAGTDVFLILDDVQYKKNEWQNRNRIKSAEGWQWVTVPVTYRFPERIREVGVDRGAPWRRKHREALVSSYARTPHFDEVMAAVSFIWEDPRGWEWLWALNLRVIRAFLEMGGIVTPLRLASEFSLPADPSRRLIEACRALEADTYLAGAGGADYMDLPAFEEARIEVRFQKFECPRYDQVFGEFIPNLSAIDYFFHRGPAASRSFFAERQES
jgi:hypothetical protein